MRFSAKFFIATTISVLSLNTFAQAVKEIKSEDKMSIDRELFQVTFFRDYMIRNCPEVFSKKDTKMTFVNLHAYAIKEIATKDISGTGNMLTACRHETERKEKK